MQLPPIMNIIMERITDFAVTPLFQNASLFFIFIYASTPSFFFLPNEFLTVPAYVLGINPILIILAVGSGGFFGDTLLYHFARHIHKRWKGKTTKNITHWLYRYKHLVFFASPSLFFGLGDLVLIFAAVKNIPYKSFAPYLLLGNLFRAIWSMALIVFGINLLM